MADEKAPAAVATPLPPLPASWYRITTPGNPAFAGTRYGVEFQHGEAVLRGDRVWITPKVGGEATSRPRLVDLFRDELHYQVEEVPVGETPLPRWQLRQAEEAD